MWREQAKMYGIDPMKVKIQKQKELGRDLSADEEEELLKLEIKRLTMPETNSKPYRSKIIDDGALVQAVEEGWEIVKELKDNKFLVRISNHNA